MLRVVVEQDPWFQWRAWWNDSEESAEPSVSMWGAVYKLLTTSDSHGNSINDLRVDYLASSPHHVELFVLKNDPNQQLKGEIP